MFEGEPWEWSHFQENNEIDEPFPVQDYCKTASMIDMHNRCCQDILDLEK